MDTFCNSFSWVAFYLKKATVVWQSAFFLENHAYWRGGKAEKHEAGKWFLFLQNIISFIIFAIDYLDESNYSLDIQF